MDDKTYLSYFLCARHYFMCFMCWEPKPSTSIFNLDIEDWSSHPCPSITMWLCCSITITFPDSFAKVSGLILHYKDYPQNPSTLQQSTESAHLETLPQYAGFAVFISPILLYLDSQPNLMNSPFWKKILNQTFNSQYSDTAFPCQKYNQSLKTYCFPLPWLSYQ